MRLNYISLFLFFKLKIKPYRLFDRVFWLSIISYKLNSCYTAEDKTAGKAGVPPASTDCQKQSQAGRPALPVIRSPLNSKKYQST